MSFPQGTPTVLVVDDEPAIVDSLQKILERESLRVLTAGSGGEALDIVRREAIWVLLTDLMMPGMSGMDLLRASKSVAPETETVLMTAYGTVENAVEAMKQGAYDFVTKPIKRAHLVRVVGKALEKRSLVQENRSLRAQLAAEKRRSLIGQSLPWRRTMDIVLQAAPSQATVLLLGESGTGKELLARAIHDSSPRAGGKRRVPAATFVHRPTYTVTSKSPSPRHPASPSAPPAGAALSSCPHQMATARSVSFGAAPTRRCRSRSH